MTYSIVARDPASGELGVAVHTHNLAVGAAVPWARPGVGAVATQARTEVAHGPRALDLLQDGLSAAAALEHLIAADELAAHRQLGIVDATGGSATHTGALCFPHAGHAVGDGVSCQGNLLASDRVWPAMLAAFESSTGRLHHRLLAALDAAEAAGGDLRGRQSAAILTVPASGEPWEVTISMRVDDHPQPLEELRRLVRLGDAYRIAGEGGTLIEAGEISAGTELWDHALELAPESHELRFWMGITLAQAGALDAGTEHVRKAIASQPNWHVLLSRAPPEVLPVAAAVIERLDR